MNFPKGLCAIFKKKKLKTKFCNIIVIAFFLFSPLSNFASHIVGGEMSYRCLGGFEYEVSLTVYRDCYIATQNFDPIASIGIFDANNNLVISLGGLDSGQLLIPKTVPDTLEILLTDPCLFPPENICVEYMTYVDTIILPPISGGYQLSYQRCCRNAAISNLVEPDTTGASIVATISEDALTSCNSSPQFNIQPPVYACVGEPFIYDQSLTDIDGDSLVYSLCTPLDGASVTDTRPQPPYAPPYDEVSWLDPPYSLDDLIGGDVPLTIDSETGIITATPNAIGLFLVGICIEEYRDGVLISTTRREFQYAIGLCTDLVADFEAPTFLCDELEVEFENTSSNAQEFLWEFNDPGNPNATSTEENPTFVFSDTGSYTVMLIAEPNSQCTDTTFMEINLVKSTLEADFSYVTLNCTDSVIISLVDTSVDSAAVIESWFWELSDGQNSTDQFPLFVVDSMQQLDVKLTVVSTSGCEETKEVSIPINLIPSNLLEDQLVLCDGDFVELNPSGSNGLPFTYEWSPVDDLDDPNSASPIASPSESTDYSLIISDTINNCFAELKTEVVVLDNPSLDIEISGISCGNETTLTAITNLTQGNFQWSTDENFTNIISDSSSITVSSFGEITYYVEFKNDGACIVTDSIAIQETSVNVSLVNSQFVCVGDVATFTATNMDSLDVVTYTWFDLGGFILLDSIFEITPTTAGQEIFYFEAENQHGCTYLDSVFLSVLDPEIGTDVEINKSCNSNVISLFNASDNADFYQWVINLPNGNDTIQGANISYDFINAGTYEVTLIGIDGLPCALPSESIEVTVGENLVSADFEWEYVNCQDDLIIQFTDLSSAVQGNITSWFWTFGNSPTVIDQNPILELNTEGLVEVELIVMTDEGCMDTLVQEIEFQSIDIGAFESEAIICNGNGVLLNPLGNQSLNYEWSPANLLDDANAVSPFASPQVTTEFTVTITDPNVPDCEIIQTVEVTVPEEEVVAAFSYEVVNCDSTSVVLTFTDISTPNAIIDNWFWQFSNGQQSNSSVTTIVGNDGEVIEVTLQVQTEDGCSAIIQEEIIVETFTFNLPQPEIIKCTGLPVNLNPGTNNPDLEYSWLPSGSLNDPESPNPIANPVTTTEYCVTVFNGECSQESCVLVVVPEAPLMADFSFSVSDCIDEAVINFQDQSQISLGNIIEWNWTFSDGSTSDLENPTVTVEENTTLEATLEVLTSDGCEASFTQEVTVSLLDIQIPNEVVLCDGNPIQLNPGGNPDHEYSWSPSSGLTDDDIASPVAFPVTTTTYSVTVSDGDCQLVQVVQVVVPDEPLSADFSFNIEDCTDVAIIDFQDQSVYSPGNIIGWNWTFSNGDSSTLENPNLTIDESQILTVNLEVITEDGCIANISQTIDVSLIDINVPLNLINCNGVGVELNPAGDPSYIYSWSPSNGLSNTNSPNPIANPLTTTSYNVTVTDGSCEITRTVEVLVPDEPIQAGFTFNFDDCTDNAVIEFTDTTLIGNTTITDWQWSFVGNNTITSDLQNPVITLNQSDTIMAVLTITTADGCVSTVNQEIEVNLIDINISGSIIYCNTSGITLNPDGNPSYEYEWSPAAGLSATNVASPTVTGITQTTNYSVTVTFGNCTLTRNIEILTPAVQLEADFDVEYLTCIDSAMIQLNDASLYSGNIVAWDWLVNSQVSEDENPIFTFYETQSYDVQLIVTTDNGCMDTLNSMSFAFLMNNINLPSDTATCNGNGIFLNPNSNNNGIEYQWSPGIGLSGDTLIANPFANPDSSQIYTVTLTSLETGCVEERTIAMNVPTQPLTAGFEWEYSNCSDSALVEFIDTSTYSGIISEWNWTFNNNGFSNEQNPDSVFFNPDTLAIQLMVVSNDGCVDSIESLVPIDVIQITAFEDTITLCNNDSVFLNPDGNPDLFYTWSPGASLDTTNFYNPLATPMASTKYFVTITSPNNIACNEVRTIDVLVPNNPIDLNWTYPDDTTICTPVLELFAQSNNAAQFIWSDQPDFQNVLSDESEFTAIPTNVGTYYLQVLDSLGCFLSDSITITSQAILAELAAEASICLGDSTQLEVVVNPLSGAATIEYTWTPEEGIILDNDTGTPLLSPDDTAVYTLLMENQFGCTYEDSIQVNVLDLAALIEVSIEKDSINAGDEVQLIATPSANWIYSWEPCEGLSGCDIANPIATPEETTTYTVFIEDENLGCIYEDSISVFVFDQSRCQEPFVFVPKGFTPNGDGLNDILYVRGNYIEEVEFVVFNRWGERVFETKDLNQGWDGKVNGQTVSPDVFGYYVSIKCFGGEEYLMKGNVTLIR